MNKQTVNMPSNAAQDEILKLVDGLECWNVGEAFTQKWVESACQVISLHVHSSLQAASARASSEDIKIITPQTQALRPTPPGITPQTQALRPTPPGITPQTQALRPTPPGITPQTQVLRPTPPGITPETQALRPTPLGISPQTQALRPTPPGITPQTQALRPTAPGITPTAITPESQDCLSDAHVIVSSTKAISPDTQTIISDTQVMKLDTHIIKLDSVDITTDTRVISHDTTDVSQLLLQRGKATAVVWNLIQTESIRRLILSQVHAMENPVSSSKGVVPSSHSSNEELSHSEESLTGNLVSNAAHIQVPEEQRPMGGVETKHSVPKKGLNVESSLPGSFLLQLENALASILQGMIYTWSDDPSIQEGDQKPDPEVIQLKDEIVKTLARKAREECGEAESGGCKVPFSSRADKRKSLIQELTHEQADELRNTANKNSSKLNNKEKQCSTKDEGKSSGERVTIFSQNIPLSSECVKSKEREFIVKDSLHPVETKSCFTNEDSCIQETNDSNESNFTEACDPKLSYQKNLKQNISSDLLVLETKSDAVEISGIKLKDSTKSDDNYERAKVGGCLNENMSHKCREEDVGSQEELSAHSTIFSLSLDFADWSIRQLTDLAFFCATAREEEILWLPSEEQSQNYVSTASELKREYRRAQLLNGVRAISLLYGASSQLKLLPLCLTTRLLNDQDLPQLLCSLLKRSPFKCTFQNQKFRFEETGWVVEDHDSPPLSSIECQMLATLMILLFGDCDVGYEITSHRRASLLQVQPLLTTAALQQVPHLQHMARWLATLPLSNCRTVNTVPLITTVAQLGEKPMQWQHHTEDELATLLRQRILAPKPSAVVHLATEMSKAYDLDALEAILEAASKPTKDKSQARSDNHAGLRAKRENKKRVDGKSVIHGEESIINDNSGSRNPANLSSACLSCGKHGSRVCSGCKTARYCTRSCQANHWPVHKQECKKRTLRSCKSQGVL